jgi:predicted permease
MSDVKYALRQLIRRRWFTLVVMLTLGLCIGANTAIYSVVDAVLLRPVPYPNPSDLGLIETVWTQSGQHGIEDSQTGAMFESIRSGVQGVQVAAYGGTNGINFSTQGHAEYVEQQRVSSGFFKVLGIAPAFGREFTQAEDRTGGPEATILGYSFWQRVFHGDPDILGRSISLGGQPYTVVGIMPRNFRTETPVDLWTPLRPSSSGEGQGANYGVIARLRPGVSWSEANAQLTALSNALRPSNVKPGYTFTERLVPFQSGATLHVRTELLLTFVAVLLVLIIGCVNIAGLFFARFAERRHELATRLALGASRYAVARELLIEGLLLASAGGITGIGIGYCFLNRLRSFGARQFEFWHPIVLDGRVLGAMLILSLLTSVMFALLPAIDASRLDIRSILVEGGRSVVGSLRRNVRTALVTAEVGLTIVLLVSAGLIIRTLSYVDSLKPGFDAYHLLTAQTSLADVRYATRDSVNRLFTEGLQRLRQIPGVKAAGVALTLPFERPLNFSFRIPDSADSEQHLAEMVYVTPGYLQTLRIPVIAGRDITDSDTATSLPVVVVSKSFARRYFPGTDAIGKDLRIDDVNREIVGIVGDVQQHSGLGNYGPLSINPTIYIPVSQTSDKFLQLVHTWFAPSWVVRTQASSADIAPRIQQAIAAVDPQLPVANFRSISDLQRQVTQDQRFHAMLFSIMGGLAVLLACLGLYGLISQSVTQRTREMGIRIALGASTTKIMMAAMKPALTCILAGILLGIALCAMSSQLIKHLIWGVTPFDPLTLIVAIAALGVISLAASAMPAFRVLRIDPAATLREE